MSRKIKPLNFHPLSTDSVDQINSERRNFGERLADATTDLMGSWPFVNLSAILFVLYFTINTLTPFKFDPSPFLILNLTMGVISYFQSPIIIIAQKAIDRKNHIKSEIQYNKIELLEQQVQLLSLQLKEANGKLDQLLKDKN